MCTIGSKEAGGIYPQMWWSSVIDQYKSAKGRGNVPKYIKTEVVTNQRNFVNNAQVCSPSKERMTNGIE
jgi:hypothetical protein